MDMNRVPSIRMSGINHKEISIYDGILTFTPRYVVECRSISDVCKVVSDASSFGLRVRPMGMGFSWAEHMMTPDVCLSVSGLNRIHSIDSNKKTITVDAGARLGDVSRALGLHGLSLPSLSFFPEVTVGGAIATATHGTNHKYGTLSDFVCSMDLVLASGEVKRLGPESITQELQAARVAVGMLGVIVRVELQAVAMPWVRFSKLEMDLPRFIKDRQSIMDKYDHVWVHWKLATDEVKIECLETSDKPRDNFHRYVDYRNGCWEPPPKLISLLRPSWRRIRNFFRPERSMTKIIANTDLKKKSSTDVWISMQYGVSVGQFETVIRLLKESRFSSENSGRIMEMKFLKGTNLSLLGPNAEQDSVLFNVWWQVGRDVRLIVLQPFEDIMRTLYARPHWGKFHTTPDTNYMKMAFPRWSQFEAVRERFDEKGMFQTIKSSTSA
ncbi:MAG: FAD-binding protein [Acidiphilium sp.]|nr:FAD-binding protein [Acidiphilium sp.]MDD4937178.1 FAD-binding protein [Acidiphilium sp.]